MADFKKNNRFTHSARKPFDRGGSRPPFRGGASGGRDFGGDREMFDAECAQCHKMTQVPFKPNGMKPVYCRDCFTPEGDRGERAPARFEKREFAPKRPFEARPQTDNGMKEVKQQLETMNATLEKIALMLEKSSRATALSSEMEKYRAPEEKVKAKKVTAKKGKPSKK
jgi:CxxC-x17-CxxC domain-containing protein